MKGAPVSPHAPVFSSRDTYFGAGRQHAGAEPARGAGVQLRVGGVEHHARRQPDMRRRLVGGGAGAVCVASESVRGGGGCMARGLWRQAAMGEGADVSAGPN